jgi:hypothetical protein
MKAVIWNRHITDATTRGSTSMQSFSTQSFYTQPGVFTAPGDHQAALAGLSSGLAGLPSALARLSSGLTGLSSGLAGLTDAAHGLIIHEHLTSMYGFSLTAERRRTVHTRHLSRLLDQIVAEDERPLDVHREPWRRLPGNCRHFTVFTVAALRALGIPARARCGFGGYFGFEGQSGSGWYEDHWVCEYWDAGKERWVLADAQIDDVQRPVFGIDFDVLDVPRDGFLVAGDAWQRCRSGQADPAKFGLSVVNEAGYWWIAGNLIRDLAALNNMEMLPWDVWGGMPGPYEEPDSTQLALFDELAALTVDPDANFAELTARYRSDSRLTVPPTVHNALLNRDEQVLPLRLSRHGRVPPMSRPAATARPAADTQILRPAAGGRSRRCTALVITSAPLVTLAASIGCPSGK